MGHGLDWGKWPMVRRVWLRVSGETMMGSDAPPKEARMVDILHEMILLNGTLKKGALDPLLVFQAMEAILKQENNNIKEEEKERLEEIKAKDNEISAILGFSVVKARLHDKSKKKAKDKTPSSKKRKSTHQTKNSPSSSKKSQENSPTPTAPQENSPTPTASQENSRTPKENLLTPTASQKSSPHNSPLYTQATCSSAAKVKEIKESHKPTSRCLKGPLLENGSFWGKDPLGPRPIGPWLPNSSGRESFPTKVPGFVPARRMPVYRPLHHLGCHIYR